MLVDYSDSESESEKQEKPTASTDLPPEKTGLSAFLPKPKNRKLVNASGDGDGPKKVIVNLPKLPDEDEDEPPTKKVKMGGGGSGLSALLPAPKRSGGAKNIPAAALSEKTLEPLEGIYPKPEAQTGKDFVDIGDGNCNGNLHSSIKFIPQSLARKPIQPGSSFKKVAARGAVRPASSAPKVSLFGSGASLSNSASSKATNASNFKPSREYKPIMLNAPKPASKPKEEAHTFEEDLHFQDGNLGDKKCPEKVTCNAMVAEPEPQDLETAAREAGLDEKAMRQLYGRNSDRAVPINIATFNVDEEYKSNEAKRALGLVEEVKPVRSIAPGKHQLSTLLNAAQSQRGALEESFVQGRKNKREAGSKYGWS